MGQCWARVAAQYLRVCECDGACRATRHSTDIDLVGGSESNGPRTCYAALSNPTKRMSCAVTSADTETARKSDKIEPSNLTVDSGGALTSAHCLQKHYITAAAISDQCTRSQQLQPHSACSLYSNSGGVPAGATLLA